MNLIYILNLVVKLIKILSIKFFFSLYLFFFFFVNRNLEISVEELQNDVKTKQCYVTMHDVESFAFILSTISRSLVDLKGKNLSQLGSQRSEYIGDKTIIL